MGKLAHKCRGQMEEERRVGMQERERIYQRRDRKRKMDKNRRTDRDRHMEAKKTKRLLVRQINRQRNGEMVLTPKCLQLSPPLFYPSF